MSLSDEEQKILKDLEQRLFEHDRGFASRVSSGFDKKHLHRHPSLMWPGVTLFAGFLILIFSFRTSLLIATIGFMVMLISAFIIDRNYYLMIKSNVTKADNSLLSEDNQRFRHKPISGELTVIAHKVTHLWRKQSQ